ncbi:MAG: AAA domain-containing protein [Gammaproteobacteria bacterium]
MALVTPPLDKPVEFEVMRFRGLSSRGVSSDSSKSDELFFPLPYNDEQITIVQRLERAPGVCVQGPPGTGKTHTIANIICHYLATGRRVLVTSRGEPALEVLQEKIPEQVRALTVALLVSDREGVRQFQASIEAIQHQVSQLNPELTRHKIATLLSAIDRAHAELASIDKRIDEIALSQLSEIEVDGQPLRAQKLAELVVAGGEQHGWFEDVVSLAQAHAPPLTEDDAGRLRDARQKLGKDLVYVGARVPSADDLPQTTAVAELHEVLSKMKSIEAEITSGELLALKAATPAVLDAARELRTRIEEAIALVEELEAFESAWPLDLRRKCCQPSFTSERAALEALCSDLDALIEAHSDFLKRPVVLPEGGLRSPKTHEAVERGAATGKPFGFIAFGAREAKEHIAAVRIAGLAPASPEDWAHVRRYLSLHEQVLSFETRWNHLAGDVSAPRLEGGVSELRRIVLVAYAARTAYRLATGYDATLPKKAEAVFERAPAEELTGTAKQLGIVSAQLMQHLTRAELSLAATNLASLQEKLAGKSGPVSDALRSFIDHELGNPSLTSERVAAKYAELVAELRRIATLSVEMSIVQDFAKRLEAAGAPKLAARVRSVPVGALGEDGVFPVTWRQAWNWARMRSHLESIESRIELVALSSRRRDFEGRLGRLYRDMVSQAAWLATKKNATPKILQALAGYGTAIRRIGQGTGPNATRYRRDAREAMLDAAGAVPWWIMSHACISEAMPAEIGAFDLVIVDEASQSDLWALPAILRGKRT